MTDTFWVQAYLLKEINVKETVGNKHNVAKCAIGGGIVIRPIQETFNHLVEFGAAGCSRFAESKLHRDLLRFLLG